MRANWVHFCIFPDKTENTPPFTPSGFLLGSLVLRCPLKLIFPALLCVLLLGALPDSARARHNQKNVWYRLYYSHWMTGEILESPADTAGAYQDEFGLTQNIQTQFEMIFLRHVGLSYSRLRMNRKYDDAAGAITGCATPPCAVEESALHQMLNLTLYAREVDYGKFNLFVGGGSGGVDYQWSVDGVRQENEDLHKNMGVSRTFVGFEYSFERIGFRVEFSRIRAFKEFQGQESIMEESFQYLTVFIPLA